MKMYLSLCWNKFFNILWNEQRLRKLPAWSSIVLPFILCIPVYFIEIYDASALEGYRIISYTIIFIVSICFGGWRAALTASFLIFFIALFALSVLQAVLFFAEQLFISALICRFQQRSNQTNLNLEVTVKESQAANEREKSMEDFVHIASHELKTPVTLIQAYLQLAETKLKKTPQADFLKMTAKINAQLKKLLMVIEDLSTTSQVTAGKLFCNKNKFNIVPYLKEWVEAARTAHPGFDFEYSFTDTEVMVYADRVRIDQVVTNLLNNVVKYCGGKRNAFIHCTVEDGVIKVAVRDNGIGIPDALQPAIFGQFFRVETDKTRRINGLGLGLYICKEIIHLHDGAMGFTSKENEGSEFWFTLPIVNA